LEQSWSLGCFKIAPKLQECAKIAWRWF
jgi:hypothetical protein